MTKYSVGTAVFRDFAFSGKPRGRCIEVVEEGDGRSATNGLIRAKLTESVRAYKKGEVLEVNACTAGPFQADNPKGGCGTCVAIQVTSKDVARRIVRDNGVDIQSNKWWVSILATRPVFVGTNEAIPMWGVDVGDSLAREGRT